ncbi:hypothetical protein GCM10010402_34910 [Actinomadura luteofluorescens]
MEDEQDPAQHLAVVQPLTPRVVLAALDLRQQRLDPLPQAVGHDPWGLLALTHPPTPHPDRHYMSRNMHILL